MADALLKSLPLVQPPEPKEDRDDGEGGSASSVTMLVGFVLLTFSFAMVLGGVFSFLVPCFLVMDLVMLFHCLLMYARTPPGSPRRELLKMAAYVLATMLVITFFQLLELTMGKTEHPIVTDM